jgi:ABC-type phosphate/phosphonate transport system substrate-binding protein
MSGMLALKASFHAHADHGRFFGSVLQTGGHLKSLEAVREGRADVCATDSVCVALLNRYKPALLEGLVEIARSPLVPGLPYVTIAGDVERLQSAILSAINDPSLDRFREQLFIDGFSVTTEADYNKILTLESTIEASGGLVLL